MASFRPYYAVVKRQPQLESTYDLLPELRGGRGYCVELTSVALPAFPFGLTFAARESAVALAAASFDARGAAFVMCSVAPFGVQEIPPAGCFDPETPPTGPQEWGPITVYPEEGGTLQPCALLEVKEYSDALKETMPGGPNYQLTSKALAALAYSEYFPETLFKGLDALVKQAILAAGPGYCGTQADYDMIQMKMIAMAYRYYDRLDAETREHLITRLLGEGKIRRPQVKVVSEWFPVPSFRLEVGNVQTLTGGPASDDWLDAGQILGQRIGETENHQLMILTARYLTNQLLYQRNPVRPYDNRRNDPGSMVAYSLFRIGGSEISATATMAGTMPSRDPQPGSCTDLLLRMLRDFLSDDFSEYNAKSYQREVHWALLTLCSYAYDGAVRLAARMVLDYVAAHLAVSTNDLRRLVPFRRRNEGDKVAHDAVEGFMTVRLLHSDDADPLAPHFAQLAGSVHAFRQLSTDEPKKCRVFVNGGDQLLDAVCDYRLPPAVHDLFLNAEHRRFFQRLHRLPRDFVGGAMKADNYELYASSPSYLITAGGAPADYAIDPRVPLIGSIGSDNEQQLGVAVTTSFMPTLSDDDPSSAIGYSAAANARDLIQFSHFIPDPFTLYYQANYGVAPDFACGFHVHLPQWFYDMRSQQRVDGQPRFKLQPPFTFVDLGSSNNGSGAATRPGCYLAVYQQDDGFACLESFDTWWNPFVSFEAFTQAVVQTNAPRVSGGTFQIQTSQQATWTTHIGTSITFEINPFSAQVVAVQYSREDPSNAAGDPGSETDWFLRGGVLNSPRGGVVEIRNPFLHGSISLDLSDPHRPRRADEMGQVEQAGGRSEIWVDFTYAGHEEGDVCQPLHSLASAVAAVDPFGTIRIVPGHTSESLRISGKPMRVLAPIGGVRIGGAPGDR